MSTPAATYSTRTPVEFMAVNSGLSTVEESSSCADTLDCRFLDGLKRGSASMNEPHRLRGNPAARFRAPTLTSRARISPICTISSVCRCRWRLIRGWPRIRIARRYSAARCNESGRNNFPRRPGLMAMRLPGCRSCDRTWVSSAPKKKICDE